MPDTSVPDTTPADTGRPDLGRPDVAIDTGPCREVMGESSIEAVPVDIIITIDNSGSMSEEAAEVRRNINTFAGILGASGIDYRVVLISNPSGSRGVCVDPPLGTGERECGSGPEGRLLAIHDSVSSTNALDKALEHYPAYRDFLRPESAKAFVWITDDRTDDYSADSFRAALAAFEPAGMFDIQIHNAIVGFYGDAPADWGDRRTGSCGSLARPGIDYLRLANCLDDSNALIEGCTPGRQARVCEADWTPIFESIAEGVLAGVPVQCDFEVPEAPMSMRIDIDEVEVGIRSGEMDGPPTMRVGGEGDCGPNGWYLDDLEMPTMITLCPELCSRVQADPDSTVEITLGCFGVID